MDANLYNGLSLAYIGDAVFEIYVRKYVLSLGVTKVNNLHKKVVEYTSGEAQAKIIKDFINNNVLTEEEISIYKRGRNSHVNSNRKNIDLANYLDATGFEALIGYLYLKGNVERLEELINFILVSK
jgi:ribonuclease-3 family protein